MEKGPSERYQHFAAGLPDWLASVPVDAPKPINIPISEDKSVPSRLLISALTGDVGTTHMSFAIAPELAKLFSEFTENPAWMNLPSEPTSVTRVMNDSFEVSVGDFNGTFTREELEKRLTDILRRPPETQTPNE